MCRREYDARIALMMLMEGRAGNSATSPTATAESRPAAQLMKLLDDNSSEHHSGGSTSSRGRTDGWHFLSQHPKRSPQVHELIIMPVLVWSVSCKIKLSSYFFLFLFGSVLLYYIHPMPTPVKFHCSIPGKILINEPVYLTCLHALQDMDRMENDGLPQSNTRSEIFKRSSSHFLHRPATMPEAVPARYSYEQQQEFESSLSLSRPHSWPGTTASSQSLALHPRYSSTDKAAEHVPLVDFLSLPERRGHPGHMETTSADGIQLDLTMATGPASEDDQSAQSSHSKSKLDLDLTLDLSMSTR
jgi:hypothetical protein